MFNQKAYRREYYRKNRNKAILYSKQWYEENKNKEEFRIAANKRSRMWARSHPEKRANLWKSWADRNRDKLTNYCLTHKPEAKERMRKWRISNSERDKSNSKKWRARNLERDRQKVREYRARRRNAKGTCPVSKWLERVNLYGWLCFYCKKQLSYETITQDHRIPLNRGGNNYPSNLVPACKSCNSSKRDSVQYNGAS